MPLNPSELDQIRCLVREELAPLINAARVTVVIRTTAEAVAYTKTASPFAFYRWCKKWRCEPVANNRWPTRRLDAALDREQRSSASRKTGSGRQPRGRIVAGPGCNIETGP